MKKQAHFVFLALFLLSLTAGSAFAQIAKKKYERFDPVTKGQANQFYDDCLNQSYPARSTEAKKVFCACSSARFFEQLRQGDLMDLKFPETWQAKKVKEKMLMYVYTPCIQPSLYDFLNEECMASTYLKEYVNKLSFCNCQNRRMQLIFEQSFSIITQDNQKRLDESIKDPLSAFLKNPIFSKQSALVTRVCLNLETKRLKKQNDNIIIAPYPAPLIDNPAGNDDDEHDHNH